MRIFRIIDNRTTEIASTEEIGTLSGKPGDYLWITCSRDEFEARLEPLQRALQTHAGSQLVDLHISDLLSVHIPSHYDYTLQYDLLVFRRLAASDNTQDTAASHSAPPRGGPPILHRIDTSPVGFAVFDRVLLTIHPIDCPVREAYASKLLSDASAEVRAAGIKSPTSPDDLMLRIINLMVDGFLELRRELTRQLDRWQSRLLDPKSRFNDWERLLEARQTLHYLDEICEDQRAAIQGWLEAINNRPEAPTAHLLRESDLLRVRGRDVLEHIERVAHHVRRLEHNVETAVQLHFNAQGNRTNEIMRTLTALTAIFLPLNLIAAIFGMNFEFLPLSHLHAGFWWTIGGMCTIAIGLGALFWSKHYLARSRK